MSDNRTEQLEALAEKVARLNPDAGEIGEGMLRQLIEEAQEVLAPKPPAWEYKPFDSFSLGLSIVEPYFDSDGALCAVVTGRVNRYEGTIMRYNRRVKTMIIQRIHQAFKGELNHV